MPMPNVLVPQFPDVPPGPGVPALRSSGALAQTLGNVSLLVSDALIILNMFGVSQWGVFNNDGGIAILADSVYGIEVQQDYRISDYPVEQGAFASYNKVTVPFAARVVFTVGGSEASRAAFLDNVASAVSSLSLFRLIMPEAVYPNLNLTHYDYRREARAGATLLKVEIWCEEIRISAKPAFSQSGQLTGTTDVNAPQSALTDTKTASGTSPVDGGTVQAQPIVTETTGSAGQPSSSVRLGGSGTSTSGDITSGGGSGSVIGVSDAHVAPNATIADTMHQLPDGTWVARQATLSGLH